MSTDDQINAYMATIPDSKRGEIQELHDTILGLMPNCKLWYLDGKDENGKVVSNPNIGYGLRTIKYANGSTKDFYQIGISTNTSGISVYILGIEDKNYLVQTYGNEIGKATVTGYCIKFKTVKNIKFEILKLAVLDGVKQTQSSN